MIDGIIKADGTSRLMKSELPATYEEFRAQCHAGTQPLDVLFNALGWSQLPTFLNKVNLLKDTTAAQFGLGADAVPDDVFGVLSRFQSSLGNEYVWAKMGTVWHAERQKSGTFVRFSGDSYYIGTEIEVSNSGVISIKNPTTTTNGSDTVNKYFAKVSSPNTVMYGTSGTQNIYWDTYYDSVVAVGSEGVESYFNSPNANAYGDGYDYLGRLGDAFGGAKVATGSYTGTGSSGKNNKTSLTLDFVPSLIIVARKVMDTLVGSKNIRQMDVMVLHPSIGGFSGYDMTTDFGRFYSVGSEVNDNTVSWWSYAESTQMNASGATYSYVAIG